MPVRPHLAVALAAVCFGSTFVVVQGAISSVGAVPFIGVRFLMASAVLLPFTWRRPRSAGTVRAGIRCGIPLLAAYLLQTIGLRYTTTSVSAFVTYLLVVLVPVLSALLLRRPAGARTWTGVLVTTVGLGLLTGPGAGFGIGVWLTLGAAGCFALNIVWIAEAAPRTDPIRVTAVQLLVVGLGSAVPGAFLGGWGFGAATLGAAAFTAVAASAVALSLQVWGQRRVGPTRASLILMLEPITAAVIGRFEGEHLGLLELAGALLILVGIAVAEWGRGGGRHGRRHREGPEETQQEAEAA